MTDYDLKLSASVKLGLNYIGDLTNDAIMWRRSIRLQGGYWLGSFRIIAPMSELLDYFNTWLGYDLEEMVGGVQTWRGMIYEMTLVTPNASRIKSYDSLYNYANIAYTGGTYNVSWTPSIDRYGRREYYEDVGDINSTAAGAYGLTFAKNHLFPYARPVSGQVDSMDDQAAYLDIKAAGYVFAMNFRFTTTANAATSNVGAWIDAIVGTDCAEFITKGLIEANSTSIKKSVSSPTRCWELINKLVNVGDANGLLYRAGVYDRMFSYGLLDVTPLYYITRGKLSQNVSNPEAINPWTVKPAVFRDMDYLLNTYELSRGLADSRDIVVEEISCGAESGLSWQALDFQEASQQSILAELQNYSQDELEGTGKGSLNWKRQRGAQPGTPEWDEMTRLGKTAYDAKYPKKKG